MKPREALALARAVLLAAGPGGTPLADVYLKRSKVPDPEPDEYFILDLVSSTPGPGTYGGRAGSFKLVQVGAWAKSESAALDLAEQAADALTASRFRESGSTQHPEDPPFCGAIATFRTH